MFDCKEKPCTKEGNLGTLSASGALKVEGFREEELIEVRSP